MCPIHSEDTRFHIIPLPTCRSDPFLSAVRTRPWITRTYYPNIDLVRRCWKKSNKLFRIIVNLSLSTQRSTNQNLLNKLSRAAYILKCRVWLACPIFFLFYGRYLSWREQESVLPYRTGHLSASDLNFPARRRVAVSCLLLFVIRYNSVLKLCSAPFANFVLSLPIPTCCSMWSFALTERTQPLLPFILLHIVIISETMPSDGVMPVEEWTVSVYYFTNFGRASIYLRVFL